MSADCVTAAKIADDAVDSEHYTDGSIDTAHIADGQVTIGKLATAVLTGATDIGAAIVDADLFLVDDGAGGTLRKTTASRLKTYVGTGGGAGTVTQRLSVQPDTGLIGRGSASWGEIDGNLRVAITPVADDSILEIECIFQFGGHNNSNITHFKVYDGTNSADLNLATHQNRQGVHGTARQVDSDLNDCDIITIRARIVSGSTNARTYQFHSKNESGTVTKYYFAHASNSSALAYTKPTMTVTEIATS